jgi:hypothetical protein
VGRGFALLDPLLRRPALVVEADDGPVRPGEHGDDEAHPRKEFPQVVLDLGDAPPRPVPGRGLILEAPVADQRGVARSAAGPDEQVFDAPLQHGVGREADRIRDTPPLQRFIEGRERKGRVGADDDGLPLGPVPVNDGQEHLIPPVSTVDVAWPEPGGKAVAILVDGLLLFRDELSGFLLTMDRDGHENDKSESQIYILAEDREISRAAHPHRAGAFRRRVRVKWLWRAECCSRRSSTPYRRMGAKRPRGE